MNEMYDNLVALMRKINDEQRVTMPWVGWARRNPVTLQLSDYATHGAAYILLPPAVEHHMVVASPQTFREIRRLLAPHVGVFRLTDQELAEMMAWHKATLPEPSEVQS